MFFYIDESGHTGANLFDPEQPILYYGVLSSKLNVDALGGDLLVQICREMGIPRLHAGELGVAGLAPLVPRLMRLVEHLDVRFDLYRVAKADHAIICFFDQVFDHGLNPAITWTGYWTPLRYLLLWKVALLFDEDLAKRAWQARIEPRDSIAIPIFQEVCEELRQRVTRLPDARSRELVGDALHWAQKNPEAIHYHVYSAKSVLDVTPNVIGFQAVMLGIAGRIRNHRRKAIKIVVDQQSQFNQAQKRLADWYGKARTVQGLMNGPGLPKLDFRDMPSTPLTVCESKDSAGLALADIYLWAHRRHFEGKPLAAELEYMLYKNAHRGKTDEISLNAIAARWKRHFTNMPEPTPEMMARGKEILRIDEERRRKAVDTLNSR